MRKKKVRDLPMPTEEDKQRARLKAVSADPLVWAMKSVDDKFPDTREKDALTEAAEKKLEAVEEPEEDLLDDIDEMPNEEKVKEIQAEGQVAMPMDEGVVTMEVKPMRQNVSGKAPAEKKPVNKVQGEAKTEDEKSGKKVHVIKSEKSEKTEKKSSKPKKSAAEAKFTNFEPLKQKKMMLMAAGLVVVAVAGVIFGVVAMVRQGQIVGELEEQIANAAMNGGSEDDGIEGDYIYLKDWGLKIKIAAGLTNLSYNYQDDEYAEVQIWGAKKDSSANYTPNFAKQSSNSSPLGTVIRIARYERGAAGRLIWYDDYYNYYYQGPSGVPNVEEDEMSWWVESYLLIKEMLTNADNYTGIEE